MIMKKNSPRFLPLFLAALLFAPLFAGCASSSGNSDASLPESAPSSAVSPSAAPSAPPETPTPSPSPTPAPTASPAPETDGGEKDASQAPQETEIIPEWQAMQPLLEARALLLLNGEDAQTASGFWHAASFAIDGCGTWFASGEALGSALTLPASVLEEIGSGLYEDFSALPEIPEGMEGDVSFDAQADAYTRQTSEIGMPLEISSAAALEDGAVQLVCALSPAVSDGEPYRFTFVIVPNPRPGNTVFTWSIRSVSSGAPETSENG